MSFRGKRIGAYLIDIFVISMLVVLVNKLNFINPNKEKYINTLNEYKEYYENNFGNVTVDTNVDIINNEYAGYMYDLQYYALGNTIAETLIIILYFTLFPRFNNNQTIGKRLCKIKVVNKGNKDKVSMWKHFGRSLMMPIAANVILYNSITSILNIIMLFVFKNINYLYANLFVTYIINFICYIDIIVMFARKDHLALHDIVLKTEVIEEC